MASAFPEDEPIFAAAEVVAEPLHEEHEDIPQEEPGESAVTTTEWNQEFRRPEEDSLPALGWPGEARAALEEEEETVTAEPLREEQVRDQIREFREEMDKPIPPPAPTEQAPVFATPGTMEEETIEEEEADTIHYEAASEEEYDEFEEETQAAGPTHLNGDAREAVSEIHMSSLAEVAAAHAAEETPAEGDEDNEELELEEAQAEAEAALAQAQATASQSGSTSGTGTGSAGSGDSGSSNGPDVSQYEEEEESPKIPKNP